MIDFMPSLLVAHSTPVETRVLRSPMSWRAMFRPGMRAYFIPLVAGLVLAISAFLPWVIVGESTLAGLPDTAGALDRRPGLAGACSRRSA